MSDGWDEKTAFGHNAGGGTVQLHARNSGMFFLQATPLHPTPTPTDPTPTTATCTVTPPSPPPRFQATKEGLAMVVRLAKRMEHEGTWDQSAYNQEQFLPAFGAHRAVGGCSRASPSAPMRLHSIPPPRTHHPRVVLARLA